MDTEDNISVAAVILAAGAASRMGMPKQLLTIDHRNLVQRAADTAMAAGCSPVLVVTGAHADEVEASLQGNIAVVYNPDWALGMGTSLRKAIQHLQQIQPLPQSVIVMLCDQPLVTSSLLRQLIQRWLSDTKPIVASQYGETTGVPALFDSSLYAALEQMSGDMGARKLLQQYHTSVACLPFEDGATDLDTLQEYEQFIRQHKA